MGEYTFREFLDNLDNIYNKGLMEKPCINDEVIETINDALPKKYTLIKTSQLDSYISQLARANT